MFNYHNDNHNLKKLREKIYIKQKKLLKLIYTNNINNYKDPQIKKYVNEINLLEEIFDIKLMYFNYDKKNFWNNKEQI